MRGFQGRAPGRSAGRGLGLRRSIVDVMREGRESGPSLAASRSVVGAVLSGRTSPGALSGAFPRAVPRFEGDLHQARVELTPCAPQAIPPLHIDAASEGHEWEWRATFSEGADVCSLPMTWEQVWRDAEAHSRTFLAVQASEFRSVTVRRVVH